jgi:hypothetical protein
MLDHDRDDLNTLPTLPESFESDVLVCDDFRGLIGFIDAATILLNATDDVGVRTAVQITIYQMRLANGIDPEWDDIPRFYVGNEFLNSFQHHNPSQTHSTKFLQSIVETINNVNMSRTHSIRTGAGGGNPQRIRKKDRAKAFRRDIDKEYHLHYWICEDGIVEFASINFPHDDFSIPE